jgi:hypothetical protein
MVVVVLVVIAVDGGRAFGVCIVLGVAPEFAREARVGEILGQHAVVGVQQRALVAGVVLRRGRRCPGVDSVGRWRPRRRRLTVEIEETFDGVEDLLAAAAAHPAFADLELVLHDAEHCSARRATRRQTHCGVRRADARA